MIPATSELPLINSEPVTTKFPFNVVFPILVVNPVTLNDPVTVSDPDTIALPVMLAGLIFVNIVLLVEPVVKNKLLPLNSTAPASGVVKFVPAVNLIGAVDATAVPPTICNLAVANPPVPILKPYVEVLLQKNLNINGFPFCWSPKETKFAEAGYKVVPVVVDAANIAPDVGPNLIIPDVPLPKIISPVDVVEPVITKFPFNLVFPDTPPVNDVIPITFSELDTTNEPVTVVFPITVNEPVIIALPVNGKAGVEGANEADNA